MLDQNEQSVIARPVTVEELDNLVSEMAACRTEIDRLEDLVSEQNKKLTQLKLQGEKYLEELNREKFVAKNGYTIAPKERWNVTVPKDLNAKHALFDYMRTMEVYDTYATINAQSFKAFYMAEWAKAKTRGEGMTFSMPGVDAPTLFRDLDLVKPRKQKVGNHE